MSESVFNQWLEGDANGRLRLVHAPTGVYIVIKDKESAMTETERITGEILDGYPDWREICQRSEPYMPPTLLRELDNLPPKQYPHATVLGPCRNVSRRRSVLSISADTIWAIGVTGIIFALVLLGMALAE